MKRHWVIAVALLANSAFASTGEGLAVRLEPHTQKKLQAQVAAARQANESAFSFVRRVRIEANATDAAKRGKLAALARPFKALGSAGLYPLLELLALEAGEGPPLEPSASIALQVGALEAIGALRDPASFEVLAAILARPDAVPFDVTRAAASAMGELQSDEAVALLLARARDDRPSATAIRAGMGSCRRAAIAEELAAQLRRANDVSDVKLLTRALSDVGNSWAWKTPGVVARNEERRVRAAAARALVDAFVSGHGEARQWANNALMVVDAPETPALISLAAQSAGPQIQAALAQLSARFANNPAR